MNFLPVFKLTKQLSFLAIYINFHFKHFFIYANISISDVFPWMFLSYVLK